MNTSSFYLVLPSNTVNEGFSNNKTSEYTTSLPRALELNKDLWEVALTEITYCHSWNNIYQPFNSIGFKTQKTPDGDFKHEVINLPPGNYELSYLIDAIYNAQPKAFKGGLIYNKSNNRLKLTLYKGEGIKFHTHMADILGFNKNVYDHSHDELPNKTRRRIMSARASAINTTIFSLFVYTNIIKNILVGGIFTPLLRNVKVESGYGKYHEKLYDNALYIPLSTDVIKNIDIKICDDLGNLIKFEYGKVIITLHFRKRKFFT
jgi:hypothetical protein